MTMSDSARMLSDMAERLFAEITADRSTAFEVLWPQLTEAGLTMLMVPEEDGGFGGGWSDMLLVLQLAGYHALAAPVGEAALARHLLGKTAEMEPSLGEGFATISSHSEGRLDGETFTGTIQGIPWGRHANTVIGQFDGTLFVVAIGSGELQLRSNIAGEPRDLLTLNGARCTRLAIEADLFSLGALLRVGQIIGALERSLQLSIAYANERVQFGKPIAKFQAVQQGLAVFAENVAASCSAAKSAASAAQSGDAAFEIAATKLRADMAVDSGAAMAHQVHGAIGFTQDYPLHHFTRRLQAWRAEFGNDRYWAERVGRMVTAKCNTSLWQYITDRGDSQFSSSGIAGDLEAVTGT